jgi:Fe-S cluster biosynthesis and repair protein YggX
VGCIEDNVSENEIYERIAKYTWQDYETKKMILQNLKLTKFK